MSGRDDHEGDLAYRCGGCLARIPQGSITENGHGVCPSCQRVQEVETRNWPVSEMCDNCAFRVGSPERADPVKWASISKLVRERGEAGMFHCHKGLAMTITDKSATFAMEEGGAKAMHACAGYVAAMMAQYKRPARGTD